MKIPRDQIKQFAVIDDNTLIEFYVESFEIGETAGGPGSKLPQGCKMYKTVLSVQSPEQYEGMKLFDNFVVGSEDDPQAEDPKTWTAPRAMGARRVNEFLNAIGVEDDDDETWAEMATEQQAQALVVIETPEAGKYKGVPQNRIKSYYKTGEAPVAQTGSAKAGTAAKPAVAGKAATAAKPAAARPAAQPTARSNIAGPATAVTPAARAAARPAAPAPTTRAAAKPATVSKGQPMIPCAVCAEETGEVTPIARSEFQAHMAEHAAAMAAAAEEE